MLAVSIDTTHGDEAGTPTPTHNTTLLSPSLENGSSNDSKKRKKARTTFTGKQIYELERQFEIKKYLSSTERSEMARILNVTEVQVCECVIIVFNFVVVALYTQPLVPLLVTHHAKQAGVVCSSIPNRTHVVDR